MRAAYLAPIVVLTVAITTAACSGGTPFSPSAVAPLTAGATGTRVRALDEVPGVMPPMAIAIVSSAGPYAFDPNPLQAMQGDMLMWTNNDVTLHHIVLEDGTDIGDVMPGQSSAPVPLTTPSSSYSCTIHPSMVGVINRQLPPMEEDPYPSYGTRSRKP